MKNLLNPPITIGIVGHTSIEDLPQLKKTLENISGFKIIFFRTSSGKLWIREGDERD